MGVEPFDNRGKLSAVVDEFALGMGAKEDDRGLKPGRAVEPGAR